MKKKISIHSISVKSFVTELKDENKKTVAGGGTVYDVYCSYKCPTGDGMCTGMWPTVRFSCTEQAICDAVAINRGPLPSVDNACLTGNYPTFNGCTV